MGGWQPLLEGQQFSLLPKLQPHYYCYHHVQQNHSTWNAKLLIEPQTLMISVTGGFACQQRNLWHVPYHYKPLPNIVVNNLGGYQIVIGPTTKKLICHYCRPHQPMGQHWNWTFHLVKKMRNMRYWHMTKIATMYYWLPCHVSLTR